jgi:Arc/MetJ-type ribon-helix-helix transcriptional regulator
MPSEQAHNVSLAAELNAVVRVQVASGHDQNASEVVRARLCLLARQADREVLPTLPRPDEQPMPRPAAREHHARQV